MFLPLTPCGTTTDNMVSATSFQWWSFVILSISCIGTTGLIRWKIVVHGFIDGYTRFVVGIRAHNNNRAQTVDDLLVEIACEHGYPCRLRGDHGVENVMAADRMEQVRGPNCGAYIWGR